MSEPTLVSSIAHLRLYVAVVLVVVQTQSYMDISLFYVWKPELACDIEIPSWKWSGFVRSS